MAESRDPHASKPRPERQACSHVKDALYPLGVYRILYLDNERVCMELCQACYGAIVMQVLDGLTNIKVKIG